MKAEREKRWDLTKHQSQGHRDSLHRHQDALCPNLYLTAFHSGSSRPWCKSLMSDNDIWKVSCLNSVFFLIYLNINPLQYICRIVRYSRCVSMQRLPQTLVFIFDGSRKRWMAHASYVKLCQIPVLPCNASISLWGSSRIRNEQH